MTRLLAACVPVHCSPWQNDSQQCRQPLHMCTCWCLLLLIMSTHVSRSLSQQPEANSTAATRSDVERKQPDLICIHIHSEEHQRWVLRAQAGKDGLDHLAGSAPARYHLYLRRCVCKRETVRGPLRKIPVDSEISYDRSREDSPGSREINNDLQDRGLSCHKKAFCML